MLGNIRIGNKSRGDEGIYVGRPSVFGNPFRQDNDFTRDAAILEYAAFLRHEIQTPCSKVNRALKQLAMRVANGEDLVLTCWCAPKRCHAEIIREVVLDLACHVQCKHV